MKLNETLLLLELCTGPVFFVVNNEKKYSKEEILVLLKFIDWLIRLPEGLTKQLSKKIAVLEEEYKMPYVTSWERIGIKEGIKEGKRRGPLHDPLQKIDLK